MPLAADVVRETAISHGVCVRPVAMKVTDTMTGEVTFVDVPCGATLEHKCPTCAEKARRLRIHQCREGWHLECDPLPPADPPTPEHLALVVERADLTAALDDIRADGDVTEVAEIASMVTAVDHDLSAAGVRGSVDPNPAAARRVRSTKRRQDAPDLPKRPMEATTIGRSFTGRDGTVYRPSLFLTVTLPSYGRVREDGTPVDPDRYDYARAARDALHFGKLLDRLVQNLRRVAGYDVQYFAAVEPQRRLAPHAHFAIRGTLPRALLHQVIAATYHQVWWPATGEPVYSDDHAPIWKTVKGGGAEFVDPDTGRALPTWNDALDTLDELGTDAEPAHVIRFGAQADVKGLLAGTPDADRRIGYLAKYLTKSMASAHQAETTAQRDHLERLAAVLAVEPCSPTCSNWLRYGIQPKGAHEGLTPGSCRSKAHQREHLGYPGRRILVSRKWSGKTLADHKADRRAFILATLGQVDSDGNGSGAELGDKTRDRYQWEPATTHDPVAPLAHRLLRAVAEREKWRAALDAAQHGQGPPAAEPSATASSVPVLDPAA